MPKCFRHPDIHTYTYTYIYTYTGGEMAAGVVNKNDVMVRKKKEIPAR